jgi:predicted dehydrogenase
MRFLIVGLGSMGKRRVRCLRALGYQHIFGFDARADRRQEAVEKYGIEAFDDFAKAFDRARPTALIISVPPDVHHEFVQAAIERGVHFFVEASVLDTGLERAIEQVKRAGIVAAPSVTLWFHPAIRMIAKIVADGELGAISNAIYHSGQYLPDWHPYERVSDFYVSRRAVGGGREIVSFELGWITKLFGFPRSVAANVGRTITIPGAEEIDDTYNCLLDYGSFFATLTVDVVSRYATRVLLVNGTDKQLRWDWDWGTVKIYDPTTRAWDTRDYQMLAAAQGYAANIGENMYIDETRSFIDAIEGRGEFENTLESDHRVLRLLYAMEESHASRKHVAVPS